MLHMDVAKVDRDVAHVAIDIHVCCKCLFEMFHLFFICMLQVFDLDVASVFTHMLQAFIRNISSISDAFCKCFIGMLHLFHTDVARACSKCFI